MDAMFALHSIITHTLNRDTRLPCAFVGLQKAFDSVDRNALWYTLFKLGLDGKLHAIVRSMYATGREITIQTSLRFLSA